jgi:hypothetical protein
MRLADVDVSFRVAVGACLGCRFDGGRFMSEAMV